jgi:hypothetical protein
MRLLNRKKEEELKVDGLYDFICEKGRLQRGERDSVI